MWTEDIGLVESTLILVLWYVFGLFVHIHRVFRQRPHLFTPSYHTPLYHSHSPQPYYVTHVFHPHHTTPMYHTLVSHLRITPNVPHPCTTPSYNTSTTALPGPLLTKPHTTIPFNNTNMGSSWQYLSTSLTHTQGKFDGFDAYAQDFASDTFNYDQLKNSDHIFMRWKVRESSEEPRILKRLYKLHSCLSSATARNYFYFLTTLWKTYLEHRFLVFIILCFKNQQE